MLGRGKIAKHTSLLHADRILAELRKIWPKDWEGWLRCWSNGREQGYHLSCDPKEKVDFGTRPACVFAEGRSCDQALVVVGTIDDFEEFAGLGPTDKVWDHGEHRQYFDVDANAARWIVAKFHEYVALGIVAYAKSEKARKRRLAHAARA